MAADPRPDAAPERPVPDSGPDDPIDYDAAERAFEAWKPGRSGSSLRSFNAGARWGYAQALDARATRAAGDAIEAFEAWRAVDSPCRHGTPRHNLAADPDEWFKCAFLAGAEWAAARGDLFRRIGAWAVVTFPTSTDESRIAHLRRELAELEASPADPSEMAGLVLILAHHARIRGVDLLAAIEQEFAACQSRTWGQPDAEGVVEHVGDAAEDAPQAHQDARGGLAGPSERSEGLHGADGGVGR